MVTKVTYYVLMMGMVILAGCANPQPPKARIADSVPKDTVTAPAPAPAPRPDTAAIRKRKEDSLEAVAQANYDQYIDKYTVPCVIDTSFKQGKGKYKLHVEHSCTFDTSIIVPKTYVSGYKLDSFVTHSFVTHLVLQKNGKKILDRTLTKKDFWLTDKPELAKYGVLGCPNLEIQPTAVSIHYTISIPLANVATPAAAEVDENGKMHFQVGN